MRTIRAIARRELGAYFGSPTAYVLVAVYLLLAGHFFYSDVVWFVTWREAKVQAGLWRFLFIDYRLVTLLVLPLVTMRLFAEERKLGTIELLWTYPVRDRHVVIGKFLAAWIFYAVLLLLSAVPCAVLYAFHPFALGPPLAGFLGLALLGTAFIACGIATSTLTENQVVAAMVTYGVLVFFWFLTWNEAIGSERIVKALLLFSLFDHFYNFCLGVVDTRDVAYFMIFIFLFLFASLRSLQSRAWRGVV